MKNLCIVIAATLFMISCDDDLVPIDDVNWYDKPPTIEGWVDLYDQFGRDININDKVSVKIPDYSLTTNSNSSGYWKIQVLEFTGDPDIQITFTKSGYSSFQGDYFLERGFSEKIDSTIKLYQIPTDDINTFTVERFVKNSVPTDTVLITTTILPIINSEIARTFLLCIGNSSLVSYTQNITSSIYTSEIPTQLPADTLTAEEKIPFDYFTSTLGLTSGSIVYFKSYLVSPLYNKSGYTDSTTDAVLGKSIGNNSVVGMYVIP
ncbi:MAG: hypothetical protein HQ562_05445 [Candidatus Marinimicrobia bacterium]|nr:hypothetical protein [Candidatus Neomarinimicrobiota bacterium]